MTHNEASGIWRAYRQNKTNNRRIYNGSYRNAELAAHASDTLARLLNENGEKGHKLNFPDDDAEVWADVISVQMIFSELKGKILRKVPISLG